MRILTAGESHGSHMVAILEGFPKGVKIEDKFINQELKRRMSGFGRGKRMFLEEDKVEIVSGLRNKITLGSPIAMLIKNRDQRIFTQAEDNEEPLLIPRPAHADLAGAIKYQEKDLRNILERASARETVARVCAGAACKQFLSSFDIRIASFTLSVGKIISKLKPKNISEIISKTRNSKLNCIDKKAEELMISQIKEAQALKNSLGGIAEVWIEGVCAGLGSFMHFDKRLDGRLAAALMSIPAVKGVEAGLGFDYAKEEGSSSHDAIYYSKRRGFYRKTNNSGGIEGGISTGEAIILRFAMKPIATLSNPLDSVNLITKDKEKAVIQRSDTCAIVAAAVIAESLCAIVVADAFLEKFGCDTLGEIKNNYSNFWKMSV